MSEQAHLMVIEDDDAIRLSELVGAQNQRVGRVEWHRERDQDLLL